jgi:glycosyltransferase involved in cell wall biosynthesis
MHTTPPRKILYAAAVPLHLYTFWVPYVMHFRAKGWTVDGAAAGISTFPGLKGVFDNTFDVQFTRYPLKKPVAALIGSVSVFRQIRNLLTHGGYDIVHLNTMTAGFMIRLASRRRTSLPKVIYTSHGFHFFKGNHWWRNALYHNLEAVASRWTDLIITMNEEDYMAARRFRGISPQHIVLTPGIGVDLSFYRRKENHVREEIGLLPGQVLLLVIAEMTPNKRHADSIAALLRLGRTDIHLAFAGNGMLELELRKRVSEAGLQDRVHFLGFRRDIPELLSAADALVHPTEREGLPKCVLEAMSVGTPVIATNIRGNADLLGDGRGLLYPLGDTSALAACIVRVIEDKAAVAEMTARASEHVKNYKLERVLASHERIYEMAMNGVQDANLNLAPVNRSTPPPLPVVSTAGNIPSE